MSFLTLEDVNGTSFDNQGFWWHEIDTSKISSENDFTDVKYDFCRISRKTIDNDNYKYEYTIKIDTPLFAKGHFELSLNGVSINSAGTGVTEGFAVLVRDYPAIKIYLYMGVLQVYTSPRQMSYQLVDETLFLNLKELNNSVPVRYNYASSSMIFTKDCDLIKGYNLITGTGGAIYGYVFVKLVKTDFQFVCNQGLTVGKVNTVQLGALEDYLPNGDLVGEYTPSITVQYDGKTLPVRFDTSVNDYVFDLDLTNATEEKKIRFKVIVEANEVLNQSETDVVLESHYETINTIAKLTNLFKVGGTGRLGSYLRLTGDLTLSNDVLLIGNDCILDLNQHKIIVPSERTFKAENTSFINGVNSIQQYVGSSVDLTDCSFTGCTGMGSVIDCQVDVNSLSDEDDFNTNITNCTFTDNDMCILHGGNLTVTDCTIVGKISDKNYPYFLYQTDGNATLLQNTFQLSSDEPIDTDLEFNTCIFICGETAQVNGYSHSELQANNLQNFLSVQRNTSKINVTYYYPSIEDYIHLSSDNGYCHSVSNVDFVFKTNIDLSRGE